MGAIVPLREAITLAAQPDSARAGRRFVRATLTSWGCPEQVLEDAVLVSGELLTNAILHAGTLATLEVEYADPIVRLSVRDYSPGSPDIPAFRLDSMTGRGLGLVAAMSRHWGVDPLADGKVVWAELDGHVRPSVWANAEALVDATADPARVVRFSAVPLGTFVAMQQHHEGVLRELELVELSADGDVVLPGHADLLDMAREAGVARTAMRRAAESAAARGERVADIDVHLRTAELDALREWKAAMRDADRLSRSGRLLTPPADPEIVALRQRLLLEIEHQLGPAEAPPKALLIVPSDNTGQQARRQLAHLQSLTSRLAEVRAVDDVGAVVLDELTSATAADRAALWTLARDGQSMELVSQRHHGPEHDVQFARFSFTDDLPAVKALRTGKPVFINERDRSEHRWPALDRHRTDSTLSCTIPLLIEGRAIGVIALSWRTNPAFDEEQLRFTLALCGQCAQALDRARLYEADERTAQRQKFLAQASHDLSASLDFGATVHQVARLIVPTLADACSVMVIEADGIKPVAHAHVDPEREKLLLLMSDRPDATAISYLDHIARTGEPLINQVIPSNLVDATALDETHRQQLRELDIRSAMAVPLRARGNMVGILSMHMTNSGRRFGPGDVATILDLADRAAMAIDNARTFQLRDQVAQTLQVSLLPRILPAIPGAELAARYESALPGVEVGGDFYDAFEGEGDWALVLGDVCGKGPSAASLTAMVRYSLRAWAVHLRRPAAILTELNRSIMRQADREDQFCTVVYARLAPTDRGMEVTVCSGGHPLPMVVRADGTVTKLGAPGSLLGLFADISLAEESSDLEPGDALVLYTDGVTEARCEQEEFGDQRLTRLLAGLAGAEAETIAEAVKEAVGEFSGQARRDDIAVLVLRVLPS